MLRRPRRCTPFPSSPICQAARPRAGTSRRHHASLAAQGVPGARRQRAKGATLFEGCCRAGALLRVLWGHAGIQRAMLHGSMYPSAAEVSHPACPCQVAVADLSLAIPRCECFGLLGPNGAGEGPMGARCLLCCAAAEAHTCACHACCHAAAAPLLLQKPTCSAAPPACFHVLSLAFLHMCRQDHHHSHDGRLHARLGRPGGPGSGVSCCFVGMGQGTGGEGRGRACCSPAVGAHMGHP